ncbi:DNA repair protein RadA homolog [Candidatus Zixiibacteriota bacterium]|nr:DNA repair protein RadA homolog [candidate division Zixibacteria bacterium]
MEKQFKTAYVCTQCGAIHPKWQGQCKDCGEWNTLAEERVVKSSKKSRKIDTERPQLLPDISTEKAIGLRSGMPEFDRVLGGSLTSGSTVLLAGEPGIGKSTLILQAADAYSKAGAGVLYVTGEESLGQLKKRSDRLAIAGTKIAAVNMTGLESIMAAIDDYPANIVIIDSIQTVSSEMFESPPGTIGQIRESAGRLIEKAKKDGFALFLVGHVTKEGLVAGPKVLEHMVDAVLYFEGDSQHLFRLLRPIKNRYGSTFELGVFEMSAGGLLQVENPSQLFLSDYGNIRRTGAVVAASCEGNRPIMVEIQALVSSASYGTPQRVAGGIDNKRLALLLAILEKRLGIPMGGNDVFVSIAGGLRLNEPAIDLAILVSVISSLREIPFDVKTALAGEVGLSGEVRPIGMAEQRISEAAKLGFKRIIIPEQNLKGTANKKIEIVGIVSLEKAFDLLF